MTDMMVYGLWIAALCLAAFSLVLYGWGDGTIGTNCNESRDTCHLVFRARATCFAVMTWLSLFLAWEVIDMRLSFFMMQPGSKRYFTQWAIDIWSNRFLFGAVVFGFVTIFPLIYIPGLNDYVFKHHDISWYVHSYSTFPISQHELTIFPGSGASSSSPHSYSSWAPSPTST
jgi:magnesium-transporting ATPase (P-type)